MTEIDDVRDYVFEWAKKVGLGFARNALVNEGVGITTAYALARGDYPNRPQQLLKYACVRAMEKTNSKAS